LAIGGQKVLERLLIGSRRCQSGKIYQLLQDFPGDVNVFIKAPITSIAGYKIVDHLSSFLAYDERWAIAALAESTARRHILR
jgi:hypothetical protein